MPTAESSKKRAPSIRFAVTAGSYNSREQRAALDGVDEATVRVTQLRATNTGPAIELLDYTTGTRRPPTAKAHDVASTHSVLDVPSIEHVLERLTDLRRPHPDVKVINADLGGRLLTLTDPDHHRLIVEEPNAYRSHTTTSEGAS